MDELMYMPHELIDALAPLAAVALIALYVGWMRVLRNCCTREYD